MVADNSLHSEELSSVNAIFGGSNVIAGGSDPLRLVLRLAAMKLLENASGTVASHQKDSRAATPKIGRYTLS